MERGARRPAEGRAGGLRPPPGAGGRGSRLRPGRRAVVCAGDPRLPRGSQSPGRVRPRSPVGAVSTLHGRPEPTHGKSRVSGRGRSCHGVSILTTTDAAAVGPEDGATGRPGPRGLGSKVCLPSFNALPRTQKVKSSQKCAGQGSMSFKDVTVNFTLDEWLQLTDPQRRLHQAVMPENCGRLVSAGRCTTKPEVMPRLEQRKEPWPLEVSQAGVIGSQ
ncbi:zinc finger protein 28 homolog [Rousettus aegyptiacus]|uniref:zinc finger protein 28 homolog n=1 Tax=Rousettus aegyptiacus TaxID=9407 RepID=UPI00168D5B9E|nr:zinc finger protein 28 homolog [Rousettus aegyptiacus]